MKLRTILSVVLASLILFSMAAMARADGLKPFMLGAEPQQADLEQAVAAVKTSLQGQGFEVSGTYAPYSNAVVIVVTSDALKANAAKSEFGGYGAGMRVAVTKVKDKIQVSYTNPPYWAAAYRMQGNHEDVKAKLEAALWKQKGKERERKGMSNIDMALDIPVGHNARSTCPKLLPRSKPNMAWS